MQRFQWSRCNTGLVSFLRHRTHGYPYDMQVARLVLWTSSAALSLGIDVVTKSAPHSMVVDHYSHTPGIILLGLGVFLFLLGIWRSRVVAIGSGLMFGGLCGNGGQIILYGYASDWLPVGGWLTNAADISGALGLLCCFADYVSGALSHISVRG